jgi:hypothetical protein
MWPLVEAKQRVWGDDAQPNSNGRANDGDRCGRNLVRPRHGSFEIETLESSPAPTRS